MKLKLDENLGNRLQELFVAAGGHFDSDWNLRLLLSVRWDSLLPAELNVRTVFNPTRTPPLNRASGA
jgi:hypothetical protein